MGSFVSNLRIIVGSPRTLASHAFFVLYLFVIDVLWELSWRLLLIEDGFMNVCFSAYICIKKQLRLVMVIHIGEPFAETLPDSPCDKHWSFSD